MSRLVIPSIPELRSAITELRSASRSSLASSPHWRIDDEENKCLAGNKGSSGCPNLFGDPGRHRDGAARLGARLPSWRDLAAQLGVSRGTVRVAYERLIDEQFVVGLGAAGTRVADRPSPSSTPEWSPEAPPLPELFYDFGNAPLAFQMGVPSQDAFPFKLWSRVLTREARRAAAAPVSYPDPRGDPDLRKEIAAYLGIARGIRCTPSQVLVTAGFSGALGLAVRGLQLEGKTAWMEDPGFPLTRTALGLAGMTVAAVPVDAEGLDVAAGIRSAAGAALAVVTPGQQAPLGMTMSLPRRLALLAWARRSDAWIIEDDYLSELQLKGRAAPALASLDHGGRVLHIGSFSKTISPALRLGFLVVPPELAATVRRRGGLPGAGSGRGRAACSGGIPAGRALPSPSAPHEAALCRPAGRAEFAIGDQVFGVTNTQFLGAYAEYAVATAGMVAKKPNSMSYAEAASVPVVAVTAWQALFDYARLQAGQTVVIHGAAGNVGAYAVQLARRAQLRSIATAGTRISSTCGPLVPTRYWIITRNTLRMR